MKTNHKILIPLFWGILILFGCKKGGGEPMPDTILPQVTITIDKTVKYQTIEGFGFFGAADVWWATPSAMWNDAWGEKVVNDLGITMWRNEIVPPSTPTVIQDCDWSKQLPVIQGLKAKADKYNVNLKFIASVWSPPSDLKWACNFTWAGDESATRNPGSVTTKNGGTLNPNKYDEYADWLKNNIQNYKNAGVDLYGLSLQNELMFIEPYNSCTYTITWYNEMVNGVVPKIKADFPNVKIFGSENMLEMEAKDGNWPVFYHSGIKNNATTASNIDVLAVHGYSDGIAPSTGSALAKMWTNHTEQFTTPLNKEAWMTETSGYTDSWESTSSKPGALNLALDLHAALFYGNISAWVWWQGSQGTMDEFSLMSGTTTGKKYSVSKHYYRYIRPGAVRIKSLSSDPDIFVTAYENSLKATRTLVIINSGSTDKSVSLSGIGLPATFKMYRTNSGTENCQLIKEINFGAAGSFVLQAKSIVTLQAGGDVL